MYPIYTITKSFLNATVIIAIVSIPLGQFRKTKVQLPIIRELTKRPWKLNQILVAKPENVKSIGFWF